MSHHPTSRGQAPCAPGVRPCSSDAPPSYPPSNGRDNARCKCPGPGAVADRWLFRQDHAALYDEHDPAEWPAWTDAFFIGSFDAAPATTEEGGAR